MGLVRLNDLPRNDARKIRARQLYGTMKVEYDDQGYICYDEDEYRAWKPKKSGRKPNTFLSVERQKYEWRH